MPRNTHDQPLFTITSAIIPNANDPSRFLRDRNGNFPTIAHEDGQGTWEETFQKFGRDLLGRYVGVDQRAMHLETDEGHLFYRAKPVQASLSTDSPYQWR